MRSRADEAVGRPVQEDGFSLLEMLVAIGILSLLLATVSINYRNPVASLEPRAMAIRVAAELRAARSAAIAKSREIAFVFSAKDRWYQVDGRKRIQLPDTVEIKFVSARPYVRSADDARLVFFSDGSSTGGQLTLQGSNQLQLVRVDWLTGQVKVDRQSK